ncbi:MAG: FkbM family methyltransferase [Planctomycetes bacterium]|nr:FkbM family methyltransferase [Planctomycetota bacterium]
MIRKGIVKALFSGSVIVIDGFGKERQWIYLTDRKNSWLHELIADTEDQMVHFLISKLKKGDLYVDVGSFLGKYPIFASKFVEGIRVYAIEPNPPAFAGLEKNVKANGCKNVIPINKIIADKSGDLIFTSVTDIPRDSSVYAGHISSFKTKQMKIGSMSLDGLIVDEYGEQKVDFLRINGIGCEKLIFKGAWKLIERSHPKILMEFYYLWRPDIVRGVSDDEFIQVLVKLRDLNYKTMLINSWSANCCEVSWDTLINLVRNFNNGCLAEDKRLRKYTDLYLE